MNNSNQITSSSDGNQASGEHNGNRVLRLGLDLHYRQVTVATQEDGGRIKRVGKMSHQAFAHWVDKKLAQGWQTESCYEAGASGYWLHRQLVAVGVKNLVVAPKAMGTGGKRQMTDRSRFEGRGKGLLCAQGIEVRGRWWQAKGWRELNSDPRLKDWMKEQLEAWRKKALSAEEEQRELRRRIEALAPALRPKGVGAYSTAVLEYEMKGWQRFHNRGQVSSYTGLCPGIHQSDGRGKEGSINRCGNRLVRWNLVEMVWRLMVWQPHHGPVRQLAAGLVRSKRAKRRLVVKAARQLAID